MIKVKCSYCGEKTYKKPSQIKYSKSGRLYCNLECQYAHKKQLKREEVEQRIGQDLEEYLFQKYVVERKPVTWIMNDAKIHSHYIANSLREFGIVTRDSSEQFRNWWNKATEKEREEYTNQLRKRAKKNFNCKQARDKLREIMQTDSYKEKISIKNSGSNNGMYDSAITEEHRIETRGLFGYKKWALQVKEKDNFTCQKCNKKGTSRSIHAHHINDYYECEDGRLDLDNGISLCSSCHSIFHNRYKGIVATEELLNEFLRE